jgi:histidinol-phosphatase (PHP family)
MIIDYHVHSPYCGHAHGKIIEYIEAAIDRGIDEIGFSDHLGRYYLTRSQKSIYWDWGMDARDVARYIAELSDLQEVYKNRISIKIGLEIDYIEGAEDLLIPLITNFPLDFCLCSIHCIPEFGWGHLSDYKHKTNALPIYKEYFRIARASMNSPLFHSLAHLDFLWRYIPLSVQYQSQFFDEISHTVETASQKGRCIEINANGFLWFQSAIENNQKNPFSFMLDQIKYHDTPITIGSDAHEPGKVGKAFPELIAYLQSKGLHHVYGFSEGKKILYTLEPMQH